MRAKMREEYICGLDVGSTAVRIAVGQPMVRAEGDETLHIIGAAEVQSEGVHKGIVTSIEDTVSCISACLERAERMIGGPVEHMWVAISGSHILSQDSKGVVAVSRNDGEIAEEDVQRAIEAARTVATPINYEILHVLPKSFTVDGQSGIKDPVGMTGVRLEVDAQIIQGVSSQIKNLTRSVYRTGVDIDDLVLGVLATGEAVITRRQKELGAVVMNLGGSTTSVAIYEDGDVIHSAVLPVGSEHITNDIALGLRTSIDVAERVKIEYGTAVSEGVHKKEVINLADLGSENTEEVSRKYVAEIIEARVQEIFEMVDAELKKVGRSRLLPAGIILTGGGSKLPGIVEAAKESLYLPATLGYPLEVSSVTDKVNDLAFSTAIGLVQWGMQVKSSGSGSVGSVISKFKTVDKVSKQVRKWFKSLIP